MCFGLTITPGQLTQRDGGSQHADRSKQQLCAWGVIKGVEEILVQEGQDSTETVALLVAEVELWDDAEGGR